MRREFQKVIKLKPSDTKTLMPVPIEIPPGTEALRIRFTYSPMKVDDLELGRELMRAKVASYAQECEDDPNIPPGRAGFLAGSRAGCGPVSALAQPAELFPL